MHPDNAFYGHAAILLRYVGLEPSTPLGVHLQHGWQIGTGLNDKPRLVPWLPKLVWNRRNLERCRQAGIRHATAIGAPFLYLAQSYAPREPRSGTIFFPFHPWERWPVHARHDELAEAIRERESGSVTICLYHLDHQNAAIRASYEARGFRIVTNGPRDDNPDFLSNLLRELLRHNRVASNRVTTAVFCGAHLGLEAEVYGPMFELTRPHDPEEILRASSGLRKLADGGLSSGEAKQVGDAELGFDEMKSPDDLRELLDLDRAASRIRRSRFWLSHNARRAWANLPRS